MGDYVQANDARPEEIITLQSNDGRDAELYAAAAHIEKHGPIHNTKLVKSGKAYYFRKWRSPRAPSVSNNGGPAIALDRPSGLALLWQSVNQSREAVKQSARRHARPPNTSRGQRGKENRSQKTAHVLSAMRCEGISLRKASRELGISSQTVRRHAGRRCVRPKAASTKPAPPTRILRVLVLPTPAAWRKSPPVTPALLRWWRILERGPRLLADGRRR